MSEHSEENRTSDNETGAEPLPRRPGRVVVAGGTGFIGRHLIPALNAAGHEVVILSRSPHQDTGQARYAQWAPPEGGPWEEELAGADAVINLCGTSVGAGRWTDSRKREITDSRVLPSRAIVAACNRLDDPPRAVLQASGVHYYGTGEELKDETDLPGENFLARLSTRWEAPLDDTPVRTVALRFGAVLGPDGGALGQMLLPFRLFVGGPVGNGRQWLSWIHVRDVVNAILFAMDSPLADAVNVTSPNPVRNREFARTAGMVLHRPSLVPMPKLALRMALGEQAMLICEGVQALPVKLERAGFQFQFPELRHALEDIIR